MTQEQQVTTQELCRLNDCITLTMDAIRRVVPQLQALPFGQSFSPYLGHLPSVHGVPGYGIGFSPSHPSFSPMSTMFDPITASYMNGNSVGLRSFLGQHAGIGAPLPWYSPYTNGIGISSPVSMGLGSSIGYGLGGSPNWQAAYGSPWHAPYAASPVNFGQRVY